MHSGLAREIPSLREKEEVVTIMQFNFCEWLGHPFAESRLLTVCMYPMPEDPSSTEEELLRETRSYTCGRVMTFR